MGGRKGQQCRDVQLYLGVPAEVVIMTDCLRVQGEQRWGQIVGLKSQVK